MERTMMQRERSAVLRPAELGSQKLDSREVPKWKSMTKQRSQQRALTGQSARLAFLNALLRDGGMIRSRVLRDPSFFFIIWPNR